MKFDAQSIFKDIFKKLQKDLKLQNIEDLMLVIRCENDNPVYEVFVDGEKQLKQNSNYVLWDLLGGMKTTMAKGFGLEGMLVGTIEKIAVKLDQAPEEIECRFNWEGINEEEGLFYAFKEDELLEVFEAEDIISLYSSSK